MAETNTPTAPPPHPAALPTRRRRRRPKWQYVLVAGLAAAVTFLLATLVVSIFQRKQEQRSPFVRVVEVDEATTDPAVWGRNWPREYDAYLRTVDTTHTRYGGSDGMPQQKLDRDPWLKRMYSGYAFSLDYRDRRGHAYMLSDQAATERVTGKPQSGACLHCHASVVPTWRRLGLQAMGRPADGAALAAADFNWQAVNKGFELMSTMRYAEAFAELHRTPDGSPPPDGRAATAPAAATPSTPTTRAALAAAAGGEAHPVSCIDCHDPQGMQLRVTRPGFVNGIRALAESGEPLPHLPSVERWRQGGRGQPYDPNADASRQEMRSFVCGQCHAEYYCATKEVLFFPWGNGLKVEQIESYYDGRTFPDGTPFHDFKHGETGAPVYKAQHPEFEMWSQGVHARSGVACADCHMPYVREGAMKVSDHWVRSPLLMVNRACQTCHNFPEAELQARVETIQARTHRLTGRAAAAMTDMLDAVRAAQASGAATPEQLDALYKLQRSAQWRLDFVSSENSMGFHAGQESARVLGEAIDYARQAQAMAAALRAPAPPAATKPAGAVEGVTPADQAPPGAYPDTPEPSGRAGAGGSDAPRRGR